MATPTAPTPPACPLAISERTLSALRDEMLSDTEAARLTSHTETCPACRSRLSSFDNLAALVRSERPPEPDERLWRGFVASAQSSSPRCGADMLEFPTSRQTWSRLGAVAAVLLLTLGFLTVSSLHHAGTPISGTPTASLAPTTTVTPLPTASATPAMLPAHPLTWSPTATGSPGEITVPAADGESAYACTVTSDAQGNGVIEIWRTSDRGATWIPAQSVPAEPTASGCELVVDASDPSVAALAWVPRGGGAGDSFTGLMTTADGGATWQAQPGEPFQQVDQLDSRGGVIYALRETVDSANSLHFHLWASSDHMATWRQVDSGQTLSSSIAGFWLDPTGSGILAVVSGGANNSDSQLWYSPDNGGAWRRLSVSGDLPAFTPARFASTGGTPSGIVAHWIQGRFHICFSNATVGTTTAASQPPTVTCSSDSGKTWRTSNLLTVVAVNGSVIATNLIAIADNGDLLVSGLDALYRLLPGSDKWQALGPQPQPMITYCSAPAGGLLMATPLGPPHPGSTYVIYTASYAP